MVSLLSRKVLPKTLKKVSWFCDTLPLKVCQKTNRNSFALSLCTVIYDVVNVTLVKWYVRVKQAS